MKEILDLTQSQHLTQRLSPRQVQFARLLEMTGVEVEEEVQRQLDDNPALEAIEPFENGEESEDDICAPVDHDPEDELPDYPPQSSHASDISSWQVADDDYDLLSHLSAQLHQMQLSEEIEQMAHYIAGNLDANGYLTRTLASLSDDMAIMTGVEMDMAIVRQAFDVVRRLDPPGVGSVDLRDCLLLQLDRMDMTLPSVKIAREIVADYFDLFSKKHYDRLTSQLGLTKGDIVLQEAVKLIRSLNPKPGSSISGGSLSQRMGQISPDVMVEIDDNRRVNVSLLSRVPQLHIESSFSLDNNVRPINKSEKEAQSFIKLKRDDAEAFILAVKQRGATLLAVTQAIVKRQIDFFLTSDASMIRPMVLRDIAADTGLDLSMISRATAGKYMATQWATYPFKMFFNEGSGVESDQSSHQLLHALKKIIDNEDKKHPHSDRALQIEMEKLGYQMARRTITKYREKLGLPVGRLRKNI